MTLPVACVLGLVACGSQPPEITTDLSAIKGGRPASQDHHDAVVGIHQRSGNQVSADSFCTGTLVSEDLVVTAAHCLESFGNGARAARGLAVYFGPAVADDKDPIFVGASDSQYYSGYDNRTVLGDIAYIRLSQAVPEQIAKPIPVLPSQSLTQADVGAALEFVGFGVSDTGYGRRLTTNGLLEELGDTQIAYTQRTGGPCSGDSGGPAFIERNKTRYLAGITSYGDANCQYYGVSTRADAYTSFLPAN